MEEMEVEFGGQDWNIAKFGTVPLWEVEDWPVDTPSNAFLWTTTLATMEGHCFGHMPKTVCCLEITHTIQAGDRLALPCMPAQTSIAPSSETMHALAALWVVPF